MYVVLEGIDGSGKSAQSDALMQHFRERGGNPLQVHEPDETLPGGAELRRLLQFGEHRAAYPGLFLANRMALLSSTVASALQAGRPVISIRSFFSTLVYQQQENWPLNWLIDIHRMLPVRPDLILILDLPPEEGMRRVLQRETAREGTPEFYERIEVQRRNRERYLDLAQLPSIQAMLAPGGRICVVDTSGSKEQTFEHIKERLA
ncbi:MAG: dTMP kinase [Spirochaetes bacterium GWB1_59_5]|nr:MAG: dTMP kinase [Spirochaetes bacterium GWB1_59_5]